MKNSKLLSRIVVLFLASLFTGMAGCTIVVGDGGPPHHAPAWGHRSHVYYDYYYYPHAHVYYNVYTGYYFYLSGSSWISVRVLPRHIHIDRQDRVRLKLRDKKPYLKNREHREKYRSRSKRKYNKRYDRRERDYNRKEHRKYSDKLKRTRHDDEKSDRGRRDKGDKGKRHGRWKDDH